MQATTLGTRAAVIGDLVSSRTVGVRSEVQEQIDVALGRVNARFEPEQPFRFTVGDEFQGLLGSVEAAVLAALWIRLETTGVIGVRMGIGWGELEILDAARSPILQDGPCWWRAREAIKMVASWEDANQSPNSTSTLVVTGDGRQDSFNAGLVLVDFILDGFDPADALIATMLLGGSTQEQAAVRLKVNKSSVSRRMQSHGIAALLTSMRMFS